MLTYILPRIRWDKHICFWWPDQNRVGRSGWVFLFVLLAKSLNLKKITVICIILYSVNTSNEVFAYIQYYCWGLACIDTSAVRVGTILKKPTVYFGRPCGIYQWASHWFMGRGRENFQPISDNGLTTPIYWSLGVSSYKLWQYSLIWWNTTVVLILFDTSITGSKIYIYICLQIHMNFDLRMYIYIKLHSFGIHDNNLLWLNLF